MSDEHVQRDPFGKPIHGAAPVTGSSLPASPIPVSVEPLSHGAGAAAAAAPGPLRHRVPLGQRLRQLFAPIAGIGYLLLKFGKISFLVLKGGKFLGTAISMVISIGAYALLWGLPFAFGFVVLILVHEMGHVIQLRREGVDASAPMFIPFLGAVVGMRELPRNAYVEAKVALAGPLLGSAGALAVFLWGEHIDSDLYRAIAYTGFFLNLFNLLPVSPLDGGRAIAAVNPRLWLVGLAALAGLVVYWGPNPVLIIILLFGAMDVWRRWSAYDPSNEYFRSVTRAQRCGVFAVYLGLAIALYLLMGVSHVVV